MSLALSTAERADILRRHEAAIRGSLRTKLATIGTIAALAGLFVYGLATLETSLWKIIAGLGNPGPWMDRLHSNGTRVMAVIGKADQIVFEGFEPPSA